MIKIFQQLITEAERTEYMLGSHGAREGNLPRGMPTSSAYANLGFYKRDPSEDIKREPGESIPEEVWRTIQIIVNCFVEIHKLGKAQIIHNLMIPYIQDFEQFRNIIKRHGRVLEVLESKRKSHEKLMADVAENPGENSKAMESIAKLEEEIQDLEEQEVKLEEEMTQRSADLEAERPDLQADVINEIVHFCKDRENTGNEEAIRGAFERYTALVYGRREDSMGSLTRSYLLLDPIISFMRFYNNAMVTYQRRIEREGDKVTQIASTTKHGKNILKGKSDLKRLDFMNDCVSAVIDIRARRGGEKRESSLMKTYLEYIQKAYQHLQKDLDMKDKIRFNVHLNKFLKGDPGSEAELKRFLITDVQKALTKKEVTT